MAKARRVPGLRPRATLLENARTIVAVRVAETFAFAHAIGDPAQDKDLHNMRIAAKRLRYTLEMFHVCLGPDGPALIETVREIQERIGAIHDADALTELLRLRLAVAAHRQVEALSGAALGRGRGGAEAQDTEDTTPRPDADATVPAHDAGTNAGRRDADDSAPAQPSGRNESAQPSGRDEEERRAATVRAIVRGEDARLGLAVLMARTAARRDLLFGELTAWWDENGGAALRARLDACLLDT